LESSDVKMKTTNASVWEFVGGLSGAVIGLVIAREFGNAMLTIVASIVAAFGGWFLASIVLKRQS
jgi:outer membrane lipoprotein SlyB